MAWKSEENVLYVHTLKKGRKWKVPNLAGELTRVWIAHNIKKNIIYIIECKKSGCNQRYIGETKNYLKTRISQHIGYVGTKNLEQATGKHFNLPGHTKSNLTATIIEHVKKNDIQYRKEREH